MKAWWKRRSDSEKLWIAFTLGCLLIAALVNLTVLIVKRL